MKSNVRRAVSSRRRRAPPTAPPHRLPRQASGHLHRCEAEPFVAFPYLSQGPIHRLFHEVAPVPCVGLHHLQPLQKTFVRSLLVMDGKYRHQYEPRSAHELPPVGHIFGHLALHIRQVPEQIGATLVAQVPRIELRTPGIHILRPETRRVGNQAGQYPGLVHSRLPKRHAVSCLRR